MTAPSPASLVFILTPRAGDLNHRYLVSAATAPDERDVQAAFDARATGDDVLAVHAIVPQAYGRRGDEWLIVRDPRVRHLAQDRRSIILRRMQAELEGIAPQIDPESASDSMCVPFAPVDDIAQRVLGELGSFPKPLSTTRSPWMPIAVGAGALVILAGMLRMMLAPDPGGNGGNDRPPREPDSRAVIKALGGDDADEAQFTARLRELFDPPIEADRGLLEVLNTLRDEIDSASRTEYRSFADVLQDERLKSAVRDTVSEGAIDAFLDEDDRKLLRGLDPDGFRKLHAILAEWPDADVVNERPPYRNINDGFAEARNDIDEARRKSARQEARLGRKIFLYHDAKTRARDLLELFEHDGELTQLGRLASDGTAPRPTTLVEWLSAAKRAHELARGPWLSREILVMHARQAATQEAQSPRVAAFYLNLERFLGACKTALRPEPPSAPTAAAPPKPATETPGPAPGR